MITPDTLHQIWQQAWPILSLLVACSVFSGAIILERWFSLTRASFNRETLMAKLEKLLSENRLEQAIAHSESLRKPVGRVVGPLLEAVRKNRGTGREQLERWADRLVRVETSNLGRYLTVLGTIGSISPFVGLFGTVVGIIHAFRAISENSGGGPGVVANGIAEALVTTALGLFVAIPAVVAYNLYTRKIERIADDMQLSAEEVIDWVSPR
jgi:biopolymer transport protein ExbB/TolQ